MLAFNLSKDPSPIETLSDGSFNVLRELYIQNKLRHYEMKRARPL